MKKLILDYSKWRCGDDSDNQLGTGQTALLNSDGFMCCLGQFSLQLNPNLKEKDILEFAEPQELKIEIDMLSEVDEDEFVFYKATKLTTDAIGINDDRRTTPAKKIEQLKELFLTKNCEIEVINLPKEIEL